MLISQLLTFFFPLPSPIFLSPPPHCCKTGIINRWQQESKDKVISLLLTHLPLLKPGNIDAKVEYMKLLPKILAHSIEHNQHIEESRQLLSYALIHPATSLEDRSALAMWLNHLEDRTSGTFGGQSRGRSDSVDYGQSHYYHQRQNSDDKLNGWQSSRDSGICVTASSWQDKNVACENGHLPLYSSSSVPATINTIGSSTGASKSDHACSLGGFQLSSAVKRQRICPLARKHQSALNLDCSSRSSKHHAC